MHNKLKYLSLRQFLPDYCNIPYTSRTKQKMRGIDGNGKPIDFTQEEKKRIKKGFNKLFKELSKIN